MAFELINYLIKKSKDENKKREADCISFKENLKIQLLAQFWILIFPLIIYLIVCAIVGHWDTFIALLIIIILTFAYFAWKTAGCGLEILGAVFAPLAVLWYEVIFFALFIAFYVIYRSVGKKGPIIGSKK